MAIPAVQRPVPRRDLTSPLSEDEHSSRIDTDSDSDLDAANEGSGKSAQEDGSEDDEEDVADAARQQISNVSFGALKQANDTLSRKRKREQDSSADQEEKLAALRQRLQRLKQEKISKAGGSNRAGALRSDRKSTAAAPITTEEDFDDESDEDDNDSEDEPTQHRSKHAPAMQSSKHQVTRKRQVIDVPKRITRDPRFDAVRQNSASTTGHEEKAYGFLREYQQTEMQELKRAIKASKSEEDKDVLRRKLNSMENQSKARQAKERERDIVRKHRQQESEQVRQGKNPYFLKRGEIKQRALVEKFQGMKGKDREKLLERRRRKESQKEKKRMPEPRRRPAGS